MDKIEAQRKTFENRAGEYYKKRKTDNLIFLKQLLWKEFFKSKDKIFNKMNMMILEPMCGYGDGKSILEANLKMPFQYYAFDYSETLVSKAQNDNPNMNIWVMDVTKFDEHNKYDIIIIIGSLHHVPDYCKMVIQKMYKALRGGGHFINFEPTQNNFLFSAIRQLIYKTNRTFDNKTERAFDLKELNSYYSAAGFRILDQMYPGLLSFVLYYNPHAFPFLNIGTRKMVRFIFGIDKLFFRNIIGKKLSFATLSLLVKEEATNKKGMV